MKISLQRRHPLMIEDGSFSHKVDYVAIFLLKILNLEGLKNRIIGLRVMAILLNGWILPIGGASAVGVCYQQGLPRLVFRSSNMNVIPE